MKTLTALCLGLCALGGRSDSRDNPPFVGYVLKDRVEVRCGPGEEYYSTSQLKRTDRVEVYRRDPGGWLAIRPPAGSFSWASAVRLQTTDDSGVAEVVDQQTPAWVGSQLRSVRDHMWQVRLDRAERIEVLGQRVFAIHAGARPETWLRIAPPAGEFRWIRSEDVRRQPPAELIENRPASRERLAQYEVPADSGRREPENRDNETAAENSQQPTPPSLLTTALPMARGGQRAPWTASEQQPASPSAPPATQSSIKTGADPSAGGDHKGEAPAANAWVASKSPKQESRDAAIRPSRETASQDDDTAAWTHPHSESFIDALTEISVKLSLMAAQDPDAWRLTPLRQGAQDLLQTAKSQRDRGRAEKILDRIREFEHLRLRFRQWSDQFSIEGDEADPDVEEEAVVAGSLQPADAAALEDPRFDGSGWLMPVHSTKREAPPYALLDDKGVVLDYVTPAPGLNLHRYVRKEIGVIGQRSYIPALRTPHLTAHRVVDLARHRR